MESRWTTTLCIFLDLVTGGARLSGLLNPQLSVAKGVIVQMRRLRNGILLTLTLVLLLMPGCTAAESSLIRLVPLESCAVMSIDWSLIRNDPGLRRVVSGDQFERLLRGLGMKSESVTTVAVFSALDGHLLSGLLLRGSFNAKEIAGGLKESGWTEDSLAGHKVYLRASDYVTIPSSKTIFAGTREGALAVFRAADNAKESFVSSDGYKKISATLAADRTPVKAFLVIPQGTLDMADAALAATSFALSLFNLGGIGQLLEAVNVAQGFGFTLNKSTHAIYPVELCVVMRDEKSAVLVNGSLNALKTISELAATDNRDRESLRAMRQMSIERKHEVLTVKMEIPGAALFPPARPDAGLNS